MALKITKEELAERRANGVGYPVDIEVIDAKMMAEYKERMLDPLPRKGYDPHEIEQMAIDKNAVAEINIERIEPSRYNPFAPYPEDKMEQLKNSIEEQGLMEPIIVRPASCCETPIEKDFEILSGHNRFEAVKRLGMDKIRCAVVEADDVEATIIINQANIQREISELEIAEGYRYTYDLTKMKQGGDRKSEDWREKSKSHGETLIEDGDNTLESLAKKYGISRASFHRKLRLTYLCEEFKQAYAAGKITQDTAVKLSFLEINDQRYVSGKYYKSTNKDWIDDARLDRLVDETRRCDLKRLGENPIDRIMQESEDADSGDKKNKNWKYELPTSMFPRELKKKDRAEYVTTMVGRAQQYMKMVPDSVQDKAAFISDAIREYCMTHNIDIQAEPELEV